MTATNEYSTEKLNYFRICDVTTRIIPDGLRTVFKQEWDKCYKTTRGQWLDTPKNGLDFFSMESSKRRKRNARELTHMRKGNRLEWDSACLFFGILYSDSIGATLDPAVMKSVDALRHLHNRVFGHVADGSITEVDFHNIVQTVIAAFTTLKLPTDVIEEIKNQKEFPTKELRETQQQLEMEKKRNEEPQPFCVLPLKPSHEVIDRPDEITRIIKEMKRLRNTKTNEITVIYLSGNPGCGKSEIARQIGEIIFSDVSDKETEVKFVFTLNASSIDTLIQSHIDFANSLRCDENSTTSIGTSKDLSQDKKLILLKSLIAPKLQKYSSWLLIVDNVTDIKSVSRYLPHRGDKTVGKGQLLVTTQDSRSIAFDSYTYHESLSRGMTGDEAIQALSEISPNITTDKEIKLQVAKALDFQPLALACAAIYMTRVLSKGFSISWEEYLQKLKEGKRVATEGEYKEVSLAYSQTMTAAVKIAVKKEMDEQGAMMHAFEFLSVMAPEPIPLEYVVQHVMRCMPDEDETLVAVNISSSSLILTNSEESKEVCVHQLVNSCLQTVIQHNDRNDEFLFLLKVIQAFSVLYSFNSDNVNDIITTQSLLAHFTKIASKLNIFIKNPPSLTPEAKTNTECLKSAGFLCKTHGRHEASKIYFKISLMIEEIIHHENHPSLANTLNYLGNSLCDLGQPKEAKTYFERALGIQEMVYHENHPTLADTLTHLGNSLCNLGQSNEAIKCYKKALAIQEKAYDENHPTLAVTLNNLGLSLHDLGQLKEAKEYLERALAIKEMAYDKNHPTLAVTLNNLGLSLRNLGQLNKAKKCFDKALVIQEMVYDKNHPTLAVTLNNLGLSLHDLGQLKEAKNYLERALAIKEMAYDENHPTLASTLKNLGNTLRDLGQSKEAKTYFERALAIKEIAYDENHQNLANESNSLGISLLDTHAIKTVPPEIIARGPEAFVAYQEALERGKIKNHRVLVSVVGPARAGKTSLLKTLKGEKFNPEEDSTVGVQLQQAFCIPNEKSWSEEKGETDISFNSFMVKSIAKKINTKSSVKESVEIAATNNPSKPLHEYDVSNSSSEDEFTEENENIISREPEVVGNNSEFPKEFRLPPMSSTNQPVNQRRFSNSSNKFKINPENFALPKTIEDGLISFLSNHSKTDMDDKIEPVSFKTLDFAGQSVYNVIHPLFMSPKSIYILVHSLENDPLDPLQPKVKHGNSERELENHFQMTNLDNLELWLSSLALHTKLHDDFSRKGALKQVFVVCTHADICKQDPKQVAGELCKFLTRPESRPGTHVVPKIYTVDNRLSENGEVKDLSAKKLKADIEKLSKSLPQMDEDIPLTWLLFEEALSNLVQKEGKKYIDLQEAKRIANNCKVNAESNEFTTLLNYLHDLKAIIYFEETTNIFIDTHWLVNMLAKVITIMPFEEWNDYADYWRKLEDDGILERHLVEHVWRDIVDDRQNTVDSLLLIMEKFSLICRWKLGEQEIYLVPSMVCKSKTREDINLLISNKQTSTMVVCFKSVHLPLGIFPRLFFSIAEFCKKEWPVNQDLELFLNFCRLYNVGKEGKVDLCIASDIRTIYVVVYSKDRVDEKLVTDFCQSVRKLLDDIFKNMRHNFPWMQNMEFEYGIRCPVCIKPSKECKDHKTKGCTRDSCLHFVKEDELKQGRSVKCKNAGTTLDNVIKEETYSHWFPENEKDVKVCRSVKKKNGNEASEPAVCQKLVACLSVQDLRTISPKVAAQKVLCILPIPLDKSSIQDPPAEVRNKCRELCRYLKKLGRPDIIIELRTELPSGMTGPLLDEDALYHDQQKDSIKRKELTRALCGNDLWEKLASELSVSRDQFGYYEKHKNPAEELLEEEKTLTVGKLYDLMTKCDAAALADKYL